MWLLVMDDSRFRGVRHDPDGAFDYSKLTGLDVLDRVTKHLIGQPIGWRRALQAV
jgi:hypothetical protein